MRCIGQILDFDRTHITFSIHGNNKTLEDLNQLGDSKVVLEVSKHREKRSKSANAYFWELVSLIAEKLGTDRESIYFWMLKDAGVMVTMTILEDALPSLEKVFKLIEVDGGQGDYVDVRCYYGSSTYDTKEMARLIDYTRQVAIEQGCDVYTEEEMRLLYGNMGRNI